MNCIRCGSEDVVRIRRRGVWARIQSALGNWPYQCEECSYRFLATQRYPQDAPTTPGGGFTPPAHDVPGAQFREYAAGAAREGADMVFQTHTAKPHAKIVLQAESHEQLNQILLALNQAVNAHQSASKTKSETTGAAK